MVDIDKFIVSLYERELRKVSNGISSSFMEGLRTSLEKQGLMYKDGEIVEITTKVELPKQVDIDPDIKKIIDEHFDEMLDDENEPKQKPPYGDACKGCKGFEDTGKCYCEGCTGMTKAKDAIKLSVDEEIKRRCEGIDATKMSDRYYHTLCEQWFKCDVAHDREVGYMQGVIDTIKKIKENSYDTD